eukprot:scaffold127308_cov36-Tisochrysis_lutea.AAC.4
MQVAAITLGVTIFNFGGKKKKKGKPDQPFGLVLLAVSLLMDAVTGGLQVRDIPASALTCDMECPGHATDRTRACLHIYDSHFWHTRTECVGQGQANHEGDQPARKGGEA